MRLPAIFLMMIPVLAAFQSCDDSTPDEPPALVVEGHIDADGYPVVCVTATLDPSVTGTVISDCIVRWAKVSLSDGDTTVILAGGPDKRFFPPYTYRSYDMKGRPGSTYTLTVEYDGQTATATTTIPRHRTEIDSISLEKAGDGLSHATVFMTHRSDETQYYRLFARVKGLNTAPLPTMLGTFTASPGQGSMSHPANRPKTDTDTADYTAAFRKGEEVEFRLATMERQAYDFWMDYDNAVAFGGSQFLAPTAPLRTNVKGGLGYFFGYTVSASILRIP